MKKTKSKKSMKLSGKVDECRSYKKSCHGGCFYCFGFVGALIYFLSTATGFWVGVLGVLKAFVWPVFLVFELLKYIGA